MTRQLGTPTLPRPIPPRTYPPPPRGTLGVAPGATQGRTQRACRKPQQRFHPGVRTVPAAGPCRGSAGSADPSAFVA